jgi:hypothetical protein
MKPVATCKVLLFVLTAGAALACGPSEARIEGWKKEPDGVARLIEAVKDPSLAPARRGQAAAALVEINAGQDMEAAVAGFDVAERAAVVPYLVPRLAAWLNLPDPGRSGDARDSLYALREQAPSPEARKSIDDVLMPALIKDVKAGRERAGRHLIKSILINIGAPTYPQLRPLLADPSVPFATIVEVIEKVADASGKEEAGASLTKRARGLNPVPEELWTALATLGGKAAAGFMMERVEKGQAPDAERAARALLALRKTPGVGTFAVRVAVAPNTDPALRELLFQIAEKDKGEDTGKALLELLPITKEREMRKRIFAATVKTGGEKLILPALESFPSNTRWDPQVLREDIVAPLSALPGFETRRPFFRGMESKSALAKLVGLLGIEKMGFASDAPKIDKLATDPAVVPGLPPSDAIGRQAKRIAAALRKTGS